MKKYIFLTTSLLLIMLNYSFQLKAQNFNTYKKLLYYYYLYDASDSVRGTNHFRYYLTQPTNNADSVIDIVTKYDSILLYGKLKLIANVIFEGDSKMKYGFADSNRKYIETTFLWEDYLRCIKTLNPYHLEYNEDDFVGGKLLSEYTVCNDDFTLKIKKKVYEKASMTIVEKRKFSKRFPAVDIVYFNDKLLYIDFFEAKY